MSDTRERTETERGEVGEGWYVVATLLEETWRHFSSQLAVLWHRLAAHHTPRPGEGRWPRRPRVVGPAGD